MKTISLVGLTFLLSSCMHMGMPLMHGDGESQSIRDPVLQKDVTIGGVRAVATFPQLELGKEAIFTIRLLNAGTSEPISGAEVYLHAEYAHIVDSLSHSDEKPHQISVDQEAEEGSERGTYSVTFGSSQAGVHRFMFHITAVDGQPLRQDLVIEGTRTLAGTSHDHTNGAMSGTSTVTLVIVGAVVMGAMMAAMLLTRGSIF
jgi:hypothetical protein